MLVTVTAIQEYFNENTRLPSPPEVALKILEAVQKKENSFDDIARIIMADPALTARILKVANSSLFGLPTPVKSISKAIALIGTNILKNIALSFVIVQDFQGGPKRSFDLNFFWKRSITVAVAVETIAEYINLNDDDIFVSGLLQDIGSLVLYLVAPDKFNAIQDDKRINNRTVCEAEQQHFGFDHTEVSYHLLSIWGLPEKMCESIRLHHSEMTGGKHEETSMILQMADMVSGIYHDMNTNSLSLEVHRILKDLFQFSTEQVDQLIDKVGNKSKEILVLFEIDPGDMKPFSLIMQEANEELGRLNLSYAQMVLELKESKQTADELALKLKLANDSLRELAYLDALTGLFNHRYFQEVMESEIERAKRYKLPLSLLLVDIDFFKKVNDKFGHPAGDYVLHEVAQTMTKVMRKCDVVARYGGEEFAIILPETAASSAKVLAQRMRRSIEQLNIQHEEHSISVTISCGICSCDFSTSIMTRSEFINYSDQALYKAKESGRNRVEI